VSKLTSF